MLKLVYSVKCSSNYCIVPAASPFVIVGHLFFPVLNPICLNAFRGDTEVALNSTTLCIAKKNSLLANC